MRLIRLVASVLLLSPLVAVATPCPDLPVLLIVQDKSGSMTWAPNGNAPTSSNPAKWDSAAQVVPQLAQQFANRFLFGVMMFPAASTTFACATGGVVTGVPSTAAQVSSAYSTAAPGGGTPTAQTLTAAKQYLQSLHLTTPAHVLLITDGMPNCNAGLNPATCASTTAGCLNTSTCSGSTCCGLGAKDCLDDNATRTAAADLLAAGFHTYVVGFDSNLTSGNNKAVLDAVALAGGTTTSYVANNQAALASALNTIALNTATCCRDACTNGAAQCNAAGQRQSCQVDPTIGCTAWVTTSCQSQSVCTNGSCVACTNQCTAGAVRCGSSGDVEQCVAGAGGCTTWTTAQSCGYGHVCQSGSCNSCQGCSIGSSRCNGVGSVDSCTWDVLSGCTHWTTNACQSGSICQGSACQQCNSTCTAGAARCNGRNVETCVADASGCTAWHQSATCSNFCSGGACGTCGTNCTTGQTRCNGNGTETCGTDANSCPAWSATMQCAANSYCTSGQCQACATTCSQGAKRCGSNGAVEECRLDPHGCTTWAAAGQCDVANGERCDMGVCIPPCHNDCTLGSGRCMPNGTPQHCENAPTGCTIWRDQSSCASNTVCLQGDCRERCAADEFETCPQGLVCTGLPEGRLCLPGDSDAGVLPVITVAPDAGTLAPDAGSSAKPPGKSPADDAPVKNASTINAGAGCGCTSLDGLLPLLGLALLALRRRSVRP